MAVANHMKLGLPLVVSCFLMLTGCPGSQREQVALFVFGDSFFDPGNNNYINTTTLYQANYWPYGESSFNPPSGRFSDGRLISDFIAEYARLPLIPAYLDPSRGNNDFEYGANFASGGSGALVETNAGFVVSLKTQLQYFQDLAKQVRHNLGDEKADDMLSNAVYLFSCCANDYAPKNDSNLDSYTHEQFVELVIGNLTDVLKGIYENGGRKFGILMIPPIVCIQDNHGERPGLISSLHNQKLSNKLQKLETQLEGFMYTIFDFNTALSNRMNNPSKYGFKVGDSACCGSGPFRGIDSCGGKRGVLKFELCANVRDYLFFDCYHPTEAVNRQLTGLFWNGDLSVTMPYNLRTLFKVTT